MYHTITKVEHLGGHRLSLTFNDGTIKELDMKSRIEARGGLAQELLDENFFGKVRLSGESIEWPNGYDMCPNLLYEIATDTVKIASLRGERLPTRIRVEFRLHGEKANALKEIAKSQGKSLHDTAKEIVIQYLSK